MKEKKFTIDEILKIIEDIDAKTLDNFIDNYLHRQAKGIKVTPAMENWYLGMGNGIKMVKYYFKVMKESDEK